MPVRPELILIQPRHIFKRHLTQHRHARMCSGLAHPAWRSVQGCCMSSQLCMVPVQTAWQALGSSSLHVSWPHVCARQLLSAKAPSQLVSR